MIEIKEGIKLFNNQDFFEAHDFFEDIWMDCTGSDRLFFQGMVQAAVGGFHLISGNLKGALSQYTKCTEKLTAYSPDYLNVNVEKLVKEIKVMIKTIESGKKDFLFYELPKIETIK